ncbi:MAG: hypothetical protein ABS87_04205 [Sphingomonas sp. SCN 67-18]|uniref:dipeptidyl-peptidase 3 family protein n=1 Tax=uncultured Sphingomonas sp. TaxID=158754 RepID=UPI00086CC9F3|nr:hypothetical protein [Sphingomonas sp. SCN 67-18]ODU21920.1 MAG: hypothetical protein ABS87_04205 [Sphingomonas sp. SCN 67-18]
MRNILILALLLSTACGQTATDGNGAPAAITATDSEYDMAAQRAKIVRIDMNPDTRFLNAEERKVVNLLIRASAYMSDIYLRQVSDDNPAVRQTIASGNAPDKAALLDMFDLHFGPWDSLAEDRAFTGGKVKPAGGGFYPADMTKNEFDGYLARHPDQKKALTDPYTVVRRQGDQLIAIPYSEYYKQWLEPAAQLLEEAAATTSNASLKKFLSLRAKAFRSNDYYESELAWMDVTGTPIEIAIGPYEVYTDGLYGAKTAFESFVTLKSPAESAALDKYKHYLRDMEANLPVADAYKNFKRGFASPIVVADQVQGGGDNVPGVQTVAFNLPNDERVREAKGAKKVILANVLGAKYDRILQPMAALVLVPDQAGLVAKKYMELETLFHELSHSLGPGSITVAGKATTVGEQLKEIYSASEEAKADVMGVYNILFMMKKNEIPAAEKPQLFATYLAGIFRAMRFGTEEAHGRGAALQYSYMKEQGAFSWDEAAKRYRVDDAKMEAAVGKLVGDLVRLQGDGDYAGMKAFFDRYAQIDGPARSVIASMGAIPVDIQPRYPASL